MLTLIVVVVILVLLGLVFVGQYNSLKRLDVSTGEAFAQIDVQLKRRADLIPNLVETVKGYAAHESGTFQAVTDARAQVMAAKSVPEVAAADSALQKALVSVNAVAENYPDLKASTNFLALQEELSTTENKVAFARQYYNDSVRSLNTKVTTIPGNLFAGMANVHVREFYQLENPEDRNAPKVQF